MTKEVFDFSGVEGLEKLQETNENRAEIEQNFREAERAHKMLDYIIALEDSVNCFEGRITLMKCAIERAEKELAAFKKNVPEMLAGKGLHYYTGELTEENVCMPLSRDAARNVNNALLRIWQNLSGIETVQSKQEFFTKGPGCLTFKSGSLLSEIKNTEELVAANYRDMDCDPEMDR